MPAIQPARLKKQTAKLADYFDRPEAFVRNLHHLFEYYAERIYRPGQSGEPSPLISAYKVRAPVLRQIVQFLAPLVESQPETALTLTDALWEQPYLEFRILAASLLGKLPPSYQQPVLDRVQTWAENETEERLINVLLSDGLSSLREQYSGLILSIIEEWLSDDNLMRQRIGLQAILPIVNDANKDVFPLIYRLIHPYTLKVPSELRTQLLPLINALAQSSPHEMAYLLRQNLSHPDSEDTAWLIRQCLDAFPDEQQVALRHAVRGMK